MFLLFSIRSFGQQNLILNGDFEEYWECPDDATQIERCKYVFNPLSLSVSTSDYFNSCANVNTVSAPQTFEGYQLPFSGNGMIGFAPLNNYIDDYNYREYIELSLSEQLLCGNTYYFEGYFNLANLCRYSLKGFEFYFSEKELNNETDYLYNLYTPQVIDTITPVLDTLNWVKISFDFVADKPYSFISIGNIKSNYSTDYIDFNPLAIGQQYYSYYYLDNVSLTQVKESQIEIPNVFTPNEDGINDLFQPLGEVGYFENMLIFNRWGNEVANLSYPFQWKGETMNGEKLFEGVYFYLLNANESCKQEQKQGLIHLFR